MAISNQYSTHEIWKRYVFRFLFISLFLLCVPLDWKFYKEFFNTNWLQINFYDLLVLTKYQPQFFPPSQPDGNYLEFVSFKNWAVVALLGLLGSFIWGLTEKRKRSYDFLYYLIRAVVRYRLGITLIAFGFYKLFQIQMPYPSLSNLLTNYGDFYAWKIYFQTTGISPNYETFLGAVEILAGSLVIYRKTVTFGAGLIIGFLGNVAAVNGFYGIGEQTLSSLIVFLAIFLIADDIPRLYNLLISEKAVKAKKWTISFFSGSLKKWQQVFKLLTIFILVFFGIKAYESGFAASYKLPQTAGLKNAYGRYNVKEFIVNRDTIPYSKTDPSRWQEVIFEQWSTISIKSNRPVQIDKSNGEGFHEKDIDRNYELAGISGRHFYYYDQDTVSHRLILHNKNKHYLNENLVLSYTRANDSTILLSGINESKDSIFVRLERINKKYMMFEGRRKPVKI